MIQKSFASAMFDFIKAKSKHQQGVIADKLICCDNRFTTGVCMIDSSKVIIKIYILLGAKTTNIGHNKFVSGESHCQS